LEAKVAFCSNCGIDAGERKFCSGCGKTVSGSMNKYISSAVQQQSAVLQTQLITIDEKYCFSCGSVIKKAADICIKCGVKQGMVSFSNNNLASEKNNIVFIVLALFFIISGMVLDIFGLYISEQTFFKETRFLYDFNTAFYIRIRDYMSFSVTTLGLLVIGIIFSVISLYRKQNKIYLWLCITPCIFLVLWNIFVFLVKASFIYLGI